MNFDEIFARFPLNYLPLFIGINIIFFPPFLLMIAVYFKHIELFLPYVSDLGVMPPEASLFTLFMSFGSMCFFFFTILRFEVIKEEINKNNANNNNSNDNQTLLKKLNSRSLISGFCMAFGFAIVANFRNSEGVFVQSTHNIGAVFGFFSTVADMYFNSRIAYKLSLNRIGRLRSLLTITSVILAVTYNLLSVLSMLSYPEALLNTDLRLKWNSSQNGYYYHVISTFLEWILIFSFSPYFISFSKQFKEYSISKRLVVSKGSSTGMP